jgi:hypothetical protein
MGVSAPAGGLAIPTWPGHVHNYGFLLAHLTGLVGCGKATAFLLLPPPGNRGRSSAIPVRPSGAAPEGLNTALFLGTRIEEATTRRRLWALVQLRPQTHHPDQPAAHTAFPNTPGQVGEQYGPSIAPFARARCPFLPLPRPCSPGGAARGGAISNFRVSDPAVAFIIAPAVLDIPTRVWPLNRAVGGLYM